MEKIIKIFTYEEVFNKTLKYFNGDILATDVWIRKYCLKDESGNLLEDSPQMMHERIASEIYRIELKYGNPTPYSVILNSLENFNRIVPNGSPMNGIGNNYQTVSLSNCFVIGDKNESDSYSGIMKIDQEQIQLMKRRGGVGHDLSHIRPKGSIVKNSALTSTGIVPFMERYSNSTKEVAQDGRRGALMLSVSINHPDVEGFIDAKLAEGKVTNANVSTKIGDEFMEKAMNNEDILLRFPVNGDISEVVDITMFNYGELYTLKNGVKVKREKAKRLWDKIIYNAWKSAEPGILFWDNIISESIPDLYSEYGYKTVSTNPCGEIPLCPYDSCRLLSLNLFGYVVNPFTAQSYFDFELFKKDIILGQRYMDDIIDLELEKIDTIIAKINNDPEDEFLKIYEINLWESIKKMAINGRRTGLGITAEGDMLAALGYTYGTDEATDFSVKIHNTIKLEAYRSSVIMAKERGAFPVYSSEKEINNPFIQRIKEEDPELYSDMVTYGRRNIALLTIAPTGTVSLMTQTTSGIEPVFLPIYKRRRKINSQEKNVRIDFVDSEGVQWTEYFQFHPKLKLWFEVNGYDLNVVMSMSAEQLNEIVKKSPYNKATSADVDWVKKVEMQGRIQKEIDHSISVTVNLPKEVTPDIVSKVYEAGWRNGCKGITIYRDGSRDGVLVSADDKKSQSVEKTYSDTHAIKRPKRIKGDIIRFQNNLEKWVAVVGIIEDRPYEIFTGKVISGLTELPQSITKCDIVKNITEQGKKRYDIEYIDVDGSKKIIQGLSECFNPEYWNYAKLISGILRHRMPIIKVYELVNSLNLNDEFLNTWKNSVVRVIKRYIKDGEKMKGKCPECGGEHLEFKEGCLTCMSCGSSKCG